MSRVIPALAFLLAVPVQTAKSGCVDYAPDAGGEWHNAIGASYGCSWYSLLDNCKSFGGMHPNFNRTANQACCVCQPAADSGEPGPRPSVSRAPSSAEGAVMIVQALAFTSSGSLEAVAAALRAVLLEIHGAPQQSLRVEVARGRARRLTGSWNVEYDVVASGQVADWHEAIAMRMNVAHAQTGLVLASRFAGAGLAFDGRTLAVGLPERREAVEPGTAGAGAASTPATVASASLTATTSTTAEAWSSARSTTGATTTPCLDLVPDGQQFWHDVLGPTYSCEWYERSRCTFADAYEMFGSTASQACCACGGGARTGEAPTTSTALSEGAYASGGDGGGSEDEDLIFGFRGTELLLAITFATTVCLGVGALTIIGYIKVKYFPDASSTRAEGPDAPAAVPEPDLFEGHSRKTMLDVLDKLNNHPAAQGGSSGRAQSANRTAWWHSEGAMGGAARRDGGSGGGGGGNRVNKWHWEGTAGRGIPTIDQIFAPGGLHYASESSNARSNWSAGSAARAQRASTGSSGSSGSRRPLAPASRF